MVASVAAFTVWGLRLSVDFRGGAILELTFVQRPDPAAITAVLADSSVPALKDASVSTAGDTGIVVRAGELSEAQHQEALALLRKAFPDAGLQEARFDSVGPAIGNELKGKALTAIVLVLASVSLYIAFVFRGMRRTLSWWVMSFATLVALAHDVLLPIGVFAWLGHAKGVEVGAVFVAALLTIMGYSISDTVVVFDRVRENILRGAQGSFGDIVHRSIMQTLVRSLNTTLTTLLSLIAIYFFGGESIKYFALALIIGIFSGAYSSIFVASPLLVWLSRKR
jgi:preprotein translocase subunit SecF